MLPAAGIAMHQLVEVDAEETGEELQQGKTPPIARPAEVGRQRQRRGAAFSIGQGGVERARLVALEQRDEDGIAAAQRAKFLDLAADPLRLRSARGGDDYQVVGVCQRAADRRAEVRCGGHFGPVDENRPDARSADFPGQSAGKPVRFEPGVQAKCRRPVGVGVTDERAVAPRGRCLWIRRWGAGPGHPFPPFVSRTPPPSLMILGSMRIGVLAAFAPVLSAVSPMVKGSAASTLMPASAATST